MDMDKTTILKQKKRGRLCANKNAEGAGFAVRTAGANCKDCVFFSSKNCGADLSKAADAAAVM